jgi:hypothetical protein
LLFLQGSSINVGEVNSWENNGWKWSSLGVVNWLGFRDYFSSDVSFESLSTMNPLASWDAVPDEGKAQILATCFIAEVISESKPVHYTKGGPLPTIVFPAVDFTNVDAATLKKKQDAELNNGRLAMIAVMSFFAANSIPGSVPALVGNPAF